MIGTGGFLGQRLPGDISRDACSFGCAAPVSGSNQHLSPPCNVYILYIHICTACDIYTHLRAGLWAVEMHALTTGCHSSPTQRGLGNTPGKAKGALGGTVSPRREWAGCPHPKGPPRSSGGLQRMLPLSTGQDQEWGWSPSTSGDGEGCSGHQGYRDQRPHVGAWRWSTFLRGQRGAQSWGPGAEPGRSRHLPWGLGLGLGCTTESPGQPHSLALQEKEVCGSCRSHPQHCDTPCRQRPPPGYI